MMDNQYPQQTLPPQQPPIPPQNMNSVPPPQQSYYGKRNWIKWGLIYLIIAVLIYGGIYYLATQQKKSSLYSTNFPSPTTSQPSPTPTPDQTANWNVYTNKEYKYSLLYPDFMTFKMLGDANAAVAFYYKKDELESFSPLEGPAYWSNGLLFYFRSDSATEAPKHEMPGFPLQEVKINNAKGVKIIHPDVVGPHIDYYLSSETGNYSIRINYAASKVYQTDAEIKERLKIYNQILSTFKFTR